VEAKLKGDLFVGGEPASRGTSTTKRSFPFHEVPSHLHVGAELVGIYAVKNLTTQKAKIIAVHRSRQSRRQVFKLPASVTAGSDNTMPSIAETFLALYFS
jgi:hypothetical protein